jgi:hypothetical protein
LSRARAGMGIEIMRDPASPTVEIAAVGAQRIKVWDLPTRLFHWVLVVLVVAGQPAA